MTSSYTVPSKGEERQMEVKQAAEMGHKKERKKKTGVNRHVWQQLEVFLLC